MDHRLPISKNDNLPIMIFHNPIGFINALIKNMSRHEILVETAQYSLPKGAIVELAGAGAWQLESKMGLPKALISHAGKYGETVLMLL
jgi:hypothetical protein